MNIFDKKQTGNRGVAFNKNEREIIEVIFTKNEGEIDSLYSKKNTNIGVTFNKKRKGKMRDYMQQNKQEI